MFDFTPATEEAARLLDGVRDDQLAGASPCAKWPVVQLVDHLMGLCLAFTAGAQKVELEGGAPEPVSELPDGWRAEATRRLAALAAAWTDPLAWQGMTKVAGIDMPGPVCALVALDEVMVHSWDLAVATGQRMQADPALAAALLEFWSAQDADEGDLPLRSIIFGEVVRTPAGAPVFERVLGLTGRDPQWQP